MNSQSLTTGIFQNIKKQKKLSYLNRVLSPFAVFVLSNVFLANDKPDVTILSVTLALIQEYLTIFFPDFQYISRLKMRLQYMIYAYFFLSIFLALMQNYLL